MKTKRINKNIFYGISRKYKTFVTIIVVALSITSCSDVLEEEVYDAFTGDNFYNSVAAAEQGLFGIYDALGSRNLYGQYYLLYFQQGSDHSCHWRVDRGFDDDLLSNYQIEETNGTINRVWGQIYTAIYNANTVIDRVTELRDNANNQSDLDSYNNVLGDAYFLRGFLYFQLVKNWGDVPLRLTSDVTLADLRIERSPAEEVYAQIEKDMLKAIPLLPDAPNVKSVGRISKTAAQGILARVYLYWAGFPLNNTSKYSEAVKQSLAVIESGQHRLNMNINKLEVGAPFDGLFPEVFHNLSLNVYEPRESMWEIHFSYPGESSADASVVGGWFGITSNTRSIYSRGAPRWYALPVFYDSFAENDSLRRDWSIATFQINRDNTFTSVARSNNRWSVGKYRRYLMPQLSPNLNQDAMNWPVIRYADVLLMYAESVNETLLNGGALPSGASIESAYDAVNEVRRRAMGTNSTNAEIDIVGVGGTEFRQQIRDERSWELCFERVRKPDLIRWGVLGETITKTDEAMIEAGFDRKGDYFQADNFEPKHVLLPIPFAGEISQNPDILNTDPSNNGYR